MGPTVATGLPCAHGVPGLAGGGHHVLPGARGRQLQGVLDGQQGRRTRSRCEARSRICATTVADTYGPLRIFRPYRDVRFSKDKTPYKENIGAAGEREGGAVYYVAFSAEGLFAATGYYHMASDQLERFRAAVADDATGPEVVALVAGAGAQARRGRRGAEDGAAGVRQGPSPDRAAASQGPDGGEVVRGAGVDAHGQGGRRGCARCGRRPTGSTAGSTPTSARASSRPTPAADPARRRASASTPMPSLSRVGVVRRIDTESVQ